MPRKQKAWDLEWDVPEQEGAASYDDGFLFGPDTEESPQRKKLKRELEREALTRMEESARTEEDFQQVIDKWNLLDRNRERRERYHEVLRGKKTPPLEMNMRKDSYVFPAALGSTLERQRRKGDFVETIFYCPYEMHELVSYEYLSRELIDLKDDRKELFFLNFIEQWSTAKIADWRSQSERNIRKIRNTSLNRVRRKILPGMIQKADCGEEMTNWEQNFLEKQKAAPDGSGESGTAVPEELAENAGEDDLL